MKKLINNRIDAFTNNWSEWGIDRMAFKASIWAIIILSMPLVAKTLACIIF